MPDIKHILEPVELQIAHDGETRLNKAAAMSYSANKRAIEKYYDSVDIMDSLFEKTFMQSLLGFFFPRMG